MNKNEIFKSVAAEWKDIESITIYGYGRQGKSYLAQFESKFNVEYIIDNSIEKGNWKRIHGNSILLCLEDYLARKSDNKILVTASGRSHIAIVDSLKEHGLKEYIDFMDADIFLAFLGWIFENEIRLGRVAIPVTEYCTLKCDKCMVCVPDNSNAHCYSAENLCDDIDNLFQYVDYVGCLQIFGGEPFSNKELAVYIDYVENNYMDKLGIVQIISNGTLMPDRQLLRALSSYSNIDLRFSDYTDTVPYKKKFNEILATLESKNIKYRIEKFDWLDMGNPLTNEDILDNPEGIKKHMSDCCGRCQTYHDGKYYYCSRQWAMDVIHNYEFEDGDVLKVKDKEELMAFHIGLMDKGYCSFCNKCNGFDRGTHKGWSAERKLIHDKND